MLAYTLFDTELGRCGLLWGNGGIVRVQLAADNDDATRALLLAGAETARRRAPDQPRAACIRRVQRHLSGDLQDFRDVVIDLRATPAFYQQVYRALCTLPAGATTTYGELAQWAGKPLAARAVGSAMAHNPCPILIPCHRVLRGDGTLGAFSAPGGVDTKQWLLECERAGESRRRSA